MHDYMGRAVEKPNTEKVTEEMSLHINATLPSFHAHKHSQRQDVLLQESHGAVERIAYAPHWLCAPIGATL